MIVSPYYASLMENSNRNCPIRKQAVPSMKELMIFDDVVSDDPLCENKFTRNKCIVHRYPDRVLFLVTNRCFTYCRHCTRKIILKEGYQYKKEDIEEGIQYIVEHKEIRDVLISGGDPLTLANLQLEFILKSLREILHVEIIRIGTRALVTMPMRIDENLIC